MPKPSGDDLVAPVAHPSQAEVAALVSSLLHLSPPTSPSISTSHENEASASAHYSTLHRPTQSSQTTTPSPPSPSSTPVSHIVLAPSLTPTVHTALLTPPTTSPPTSSPLAILIRPPPSTSARFTPLPPHTLLLSAPAAFAQHLTLGFNLPLASELGVLPGTALPLFDPSPHRAGQTVGLVGRIDPVEAGKYRFQTEALERRLREIVGGEAGVVNRVSDVFRLCVGVSEEGVIGVFDFRGGGGGGGGSAKSECESMGKGKGMGNVDEARVKMNGIPEDDEEEDEEEGLEGWNQNQNQGQDQEVYMSERTFASPSPTTPTFPDSNGALLPSKLTNPTTNSSSPSILPSPSPTPRAACSITTLILSHTISPQTVAHAHSLALSSGYLPTPSSRILFITAQPRQAGLEAARERNMLVMCVTGNAANFWGLRYIGRRIEERWPRVDVRVVVKK